jgi:hypothetical protein
MASITIQYSNILYHNVMGPPSYMRSVVDRSVVMRRIPVCAFWALGNCPRLPSESVILLQGNARPHTGQQTTFAWASSYRPPYSPHLAPTDFHVSAFEGTIVRISLSPAIETSNLLLLRGWRKRDIRSRSPERKKKLSQT